MAKRGTRTSLVDRWALRGDLSLHRSPFGETSEGYQDFRGFPYLARQIVEDVCIAKCDFSFADFRQLKLERVEFIDCRFRGTTFDGGGERRSLFRQCAFVRSSFRYYGMGAFQSRYEGCKFERNTFVKPTIQDAIFCDTEFNDNKMRTVFFNAVGFWRCRFVGPLCDLVFCGTSPQEGLSGGKPPAEAGFHQVDLSEAILTYVSFRWKFALEDVILPTDGSCIFFEVTKAIANLHTLAAEFPQHELELKRLADMLLFEEIGQPVTIFSLHDLEEFFDLATALAIFDRFKLHGKH